jgi:hypothetical protein
MSFNFNARNPHNNRPAFRTLIARKQAFFKRLCRRYKTTKNPAERSFLRAEAKRVVQELKAFKAQWNRNGFGGNGWITRGIKVTGMNNTAGTRRTMRTRRNKTRTSARRTRRTSSRSYRSYVAW